MKKNILKLISGVVSITCLCTSLPVMAEDITQQNTDTSYFETVETPETEIISDNTDELPVEDDMFNVSSDEHISEDLFNDDLDILDIDDTKEEENKETTEKEDQEAVKEIKKPFDNMDKDSTLKLFSTIVDSGTCGSNLTWTLDDEGTLTISGTGKMKNAYFADLPFFNNENIKSVIIEDGVTDIGVYAFYCCYNLETITIPNSVTKIGNEAFYHCKNLQNITIPDSVIDIGAAAFDGCENLTNITLPNNITTIESQLFIGCSNLTSIIIPENVTSISGSAFEGCTGLTSITIPDSVTSIGNWAFDNCTGLTSITIPDNVTNIGKGAFGSCTGLTTMTIPNNVTNINEGLFSSCTNLKNVTLSNNINNIPDNTFNYCKNLTEINIPDSVINIGDKAFFDCDGLTTISIPDSVVGIGSEVFAYCSNLKTVILSNNITIIPDAFYACDKITKMVIGSNLTDITLSHGCNPQYYVNALPLAHEVDFEASPYNKLPTDKTTYLYDVAPYSTTKTYTGEEFTPITTLSIKNKITNEIKDALVEGEDFTVSYRNNTNTGTATAEITYRGDYADYAGDIKTMSFYIEPRNLSDVSITLSEPDYTGDTTEAQATVTYNGNTLTRGIDYDATYTVTELPNPDGSANGKGIATFTGKGNYTGTVTKEFVVKPYNPHNGVAPVKLENLNISCEDNQSFAFNGEEQKITPVLTYEISDDYIYTLIEGTDYTLTYTENCTDAGNKQLTVTGVQQGTGGFEGSQNFNFTIAPANMSTVSISDIEDVNFNHNAFTPKPVITFNGTTLEEGTDYELNYENNTNAGQATVSVTGKGNYTDTATKQFNINKLNLNSAIVSEISNKVYNRGNITPEPTITIDDVTLVKDEDYTLEYTDNVQAGTANITIKGINSVENEINTSFTIEPKPGNSFFITILDLDKWQ